MPTWTSLLGILDSGSDNDRDDEEDGFEVGAKLFENPPFLG